MEFLAEGACGSVYVLSSDWLVKQPSGKDGKDDLANEKRIYEMLGLAHLTGRICPSFLPSEEEDLTIAYLHGESLYKALRRLSPEEAMELLQEVSVILAQFHGEGFVHQDLHCGNVMVVEGRPFLIDFGLTTHVSICQRAQRAWSICVGADRRGLVASIGMFCPEYREVAKAALL